MKNKSIFTRQNQTLIKLFRDAGHPAKVLCIPLDYAKSTHAALCCNGAGTSDLGLGLSMVKVITKAHGGRVLVESQLGKGSEFSILIPINAERPL